MSYLDNPGPSSMRKRQESLVGPPVPENPSLGKGKKKKSIVDVIFPTINNSEETTTTWEEFSTITTTPITTEVTELPTTAITTTVFVSSTTPIETTLNTEITPTSAPDVPQQKLPYSQNEASNSIFPVEQLVLPILVLFVLFGSFVYVLFKSRTKNNTRTDPVASISTLEKGSVLGFKKKNAIISREKGPAVVSQEKGNAIVSSKGLAVANLEKARVNTKWRLSGIPFSLDSSKVEVLRRFNSEDELSDQKEMTQDSVFTFPAPPETSPSHEKVSTLSVHIEDVLFPANTNGLSSASSGTSSNLERL
jgi:hypothetical protein